MRVMTTSKKQPTGRRAVMGVALLSAAVLGACDVTNPGPIQDEFLVDPEAQIGLINGAHRSIAEIYGDRAFDMAMFTREIFPGGQIGAWGNPVHVHAGNTQPDYGPGFNALQEARFIAETAITRFTEAGATDEILHQAHMWAGWAYRILGEWFCDTVLPSTDPANTDPPAFFTGTDPYMERAVDAFTSALGFAATPSERAGARAGRAQAHAWMGNWAEAFADASAVVGEVNGGWSFVVEQDPIETAIYNYVFEANSGTFRSSTVRFTWFLDYYEETGDPRTPWEVDPNNSVAVGSLDGFGQVPYIPQKKFRNRTADFNVASFWEMKLLQAEAILRGQGSGDPMDALALINEVRTRNESDIDGEPLAPWTATTAEEVWTVLKRERRIELWLEGRSAPDERRWTRQNAPGEIDMPRWEEDEPEGSFTTLFTRFPRAPLCLDIPTGERDRNQNVPRVSALPRLN